MKFSDLREKDAKLAGLIEKEIRRQAETINLIASENVVSPEVLEALGSPLVNKYSEGYPGKRYYPGNGFYDEIEELARARAIEAFRLTPKRWGVNVQPYSGSPANLAVYLALAVPGETILGMSLAAGGHLTHGHRASATGKIFRAVQYGVNEKGWIDYEEIGILAKKHKPKIIISGVSAYPRKIDFKKIGAIARGVGAYHVADIAHIAGLVLAELHPSPFPYADVVVTTTHKTLRGPRGAVIFARREPLKINPKFQRTNNKQIQNKKLETGKEGITIYEAVNKAVFPGVQGGPHNNQTAAVATAMLEATRPEFLKYQRQVAANARELASELAAKGFKLVTGGTDNHLLVINLKETGLDGLEAERLLEEIAVIANRNVVPGDEKPFRPSGIRMGTPAVTSRGMKEEEMKIIADLIYRRLVLKEAAGRLKREARALVKRFLLKY